MLRETARSGFIDRLQFVVAQDAVGWTSLKEGELSSRFFLAVFGVSAFLLRAQPKLRVFT